MLKFSQDYPGPPVPQHPKDCSVTTYVGHRVLKTLIRCHFSPPSSTGQQYLYSGSEDGRVHIWNLDGTVAQVIDVGKVLTKAYLHPSRFEGGGWEYFGLGARRRRTAVSATVRDVSWHPYEGVLVYSLSYWLFRLQCSGDFVVDICWGERCCHNSCMGGRDGITWAVYEILIMLCNWCSEYARRAIVRAIRGAP
jgi:WD40 repeat protein